MLATDQNLPSKNALSLLGQIIFNILVANTDAHANNYSLLLSPAKALAPLYDVSSLLPWRDNQINQTFAHKIAGKKHRPADIHGRHWEAIATTAGYNPRETKKRVEELIDAIIKTGHDVAA